jgi:hypothetical protein
VKEITYENYMKVTSETRKMGLDEKAVSALSKQPLSISELACVLYGKSNEDTNNLTNGFLSNFRKTHKVVTRYCQGNAVIALADLVK